MCGGFKYTLPIFPALVVTVPVPILFFCSSNNIYNKIYNNNIIPIVVRSLFFSLIIALIFIIIEIVSYNNTGS